MKRMMFLFPLIVLVLGCATTTLKKEIDNISKIHLLTVLVDAPVTLKNPEGEDTLIYATLESGGQNLDFEWAYSVNSPMNYSYDLSTITEKAFTDIDKKIREAAPTKLADLSETESLQKYNDILKYLARNMSTVSIYDFSWWKKWDDLMKSPQMSAFLNANPGQGFIIVVMVMEDVGQSSIRKEFKMGERKYFFNAGFKYPRYIRYRFWNYLDMRYAAKPKANLLRPVGFYTGPKIELVHSKSIEFKVVQPASVRVTNWYSPIFVEVDAGIYETDIDLEELETTIINGAGEMASQIGAGLEAFILKLQS